MDDVFCGYGIPVKITKPDGFLILKETLTRIGVPSKNGRRLYQSCSLLHKTDVNGDSHYAILHFKELFGLSGKKSYMCLDDIARRNTICKILEDWNLVKIINPEILTEFSPTSSIKILKAADKSNWKLIEKFKVGK